MARDYDGGNTTGFVSPAGDSLEGPIDLSEILDLRRTHRYPVRVKCALLGWMAFKDAATRAGAEKEGT